ncbi:MAG TPA: FAD-dependent oxidoreductase [Anaerolineae bacterium]|nr:FAD-dependent oxidoreductase [Anaerolineae bacterium]
MARNDRTFILGGGVTGLAAGMTSGAPVFEATTRPGGICSSYYVPPGEREQLPAPPPDGEAYRFEIGGGHWIFGGDPTILHFIENVTPGKRYERNSAVYFGRDGRYVPYPLQNNLRYLEPETASQALQELAGQEGPRTTMKEWLERSFGPTLGEMFFDPFHQLYTGGLYDRIAPQDAYKSPVDIKTAVAGAFGGAAAVGYNVTFFYPEDGLNALAQRMAGAADVRYEKRVAAIDPRSRVVHLQDGTEAAYDRLLSTLPLNKMMEMTGLTVESQADPYTSVLVLNIGARRGEKCPDAHWLYNSDTRSGFHRVGFYSNVDSSFMPRSMRPTNAGVSIYVERAFEGGSAPSPQEQEEYSQAVVQELQEWGFIEDVDVVDPTWIDVAYTWAWPGSRWKQQALNCLEKENIFQVGRYARWIFQGIADSIRDGFYAGASMRSL